MSYLIDTNVISELRRNQPDAQVVQWVERRPASVLYLSVLSVGEIRRGVEALAAGRRRVALLDWLEVDLPEFFGTRLLAVDLAVAGVGAACWRRRRGRCRPSMVCWRPQHCTMG